MGHPRAAGAAAAALVGAALGLAGAVMQGLLRNPLAEPGVLGVSAGVGAGAAALAIALGLAGAARGDRGARRWPARWPPARWWRCWPRAFREPETLILFGVALSALGGALTALIFNLSPSPITTSEVLTWLLGSVANRDWSDMAAALSADGAGRRRSAPTRRAACAC